MRKSRREAHAKARLVTILSGNEIGQISDIAMVELLEHVADEFSDTESGRIAQHIIEQYAFGDAESWE